MVSLARMAFLMSSGSWVAGLLMALSYHVHRFRQEKLPDWGGFEKLDRTAKHSADAGVLPDVAAFPKDAVNY